MRDPIKICYTINNGFVDLCCASIFSIILRRDQDTCLEFYVLGDRLEHPDTFSMFDNICGVSVKVYQIDADEIMNQRKNHHGRGNISWIRLLIPDFDVFHGMKKLLYLDADIFALRDISNIFNTDLQGYSVGMVKDAAAILYTDIEYPYPPYKMSAFPYCCNAGLMLMDVEKWIRREWCKILLDEATRNESLDDQDTLNRVILRDTLLLPPIYQLSYHDIVRFPNMLPSYIGRWNNHYNTRYDSIEELVRSSYMWHFHEDKKAHMQHPVLKEIINSFMNDMLAFRESGLMKNWKPEDDEPLYRYGLNK